MANLHDNITNIGVHILILFLSVYERIKPKQNQTKTVNKQISY